MSVLAKAISVVVSKAAVDRGYPGGLAALRREAPAETFCTDGILVRAGFDRLSEARGFIGHLSWRGLRPESGGLAADCVVVDEVRGPLSRCLWLEFGRNRFGVPMCWHTAGRRGPLCLPPEPRAAGGHPSTAPGDSLTALCYSFRTHAAADSEQSPGSTCRRAG